MAKIEKPQAVTRLEEIVRAADCVMVARGDLGIEMEIEEVPIVQKQIIALAGALARPVITATQMLDSMVASSRPTRAEVTDVANAILDGTDAVMLSQESAVGQYPVESVAMLASIAKRTEQTAPVPGVERAPRAARPPRPRVHARLHGHAGGAGAQPRRAGLPDAVAAARARLISAHRPTVPIYALSPGRETVRRCGLMWGVQAASMRRYEVTEELIAAAARRVVELGWCKPGDRVGITAGLPSGKPGTTSPAADPGGVSDWLNEPSAWSGDGVRPDRARRAGAPTSGARPTTASSRDNGHFADVWLELALRFRGEFAAQYDQAGLMLRVDAAHWIKAGLELDGRLWLSVVVTNGVSDWSQQPAPAPDADGWWDDPRRPRGRRRPDLVRRAAGPPRPVRPATSLSGPMCAAPKGPGSPHFALSPR